MEYLWFVYLILSIVLLTYGVGQLTGLGWAWFLFDLITQTAPGDYAELQKSSPPAKKRKKKIIGLFSIFFGLVFGYLVIGGLR